MGASKKQCLVPKKTLPLFKFFPTKYKIKLPDNRLTHVKNFQYGLSKPRILEGKVNEIPKIIGTIYPCPLHHHITSLLILFGLFFIHYYTLKTILITLSRHE